MFQTEEPDKTPETELYETEIIDLPDRIQNNSCKDAHHGQENNTCTRWEFQQINRKYLKGPKNHRTEEYNHWTGNFNRGVQ